MAMLGAALGAGGCASERPESADERMVAALMALDKQTGDLVAEIEAAAKKASETGKVFQESGSNSEQVIFVDGADAFGCVDVGSSGAMCERAPFVFSPTTPNTVSLNRKDGALVYAGDGDFAVQVVDNGSTGAQSVTSMFLGEKNCGISRSDNGHSATESTKSLEIVKKCAALRDVLRARMKKIVAFAVSLKSH